MNLKQQFLTKNDCYKAGKKITVKGLMLHSTGANNPKLSRYIQPDDGVLGDNPHNNDWNNPDIEKCVHGFIGEDKDGKVKTYQTLPWNHRGWHAGGKANDTHVGVEICEDDLQDEKYFKAVYKEAVELFTHLCKEFDLTEKDILDHSEGHAKGIASNHGDVKHWFSKHGKSMDTFRADVKKALQPAPKPKVTPEQVKEAMKPKKPTPKPVKTISQLADEVMKGQHGSGRERMLSLGVNYAKVQQEVNRRIRHK